jgi:DNA-directed RNA polymerase subunit RPC12/RpoP
MKPMRLLTCALLSIVLLSCEPPEATPYYGCAPRAGLRLLEYWHGQGLPTPLDSMSSAECESLLAVAMGTSSSGQTSAMAIARGVELTCPALTTWLAYDSDTTAWLCNRLPCLLLLHDESHVRFVESPGDAPSGYWTLVIAEPNWVCEDCGVSFAPTIQTMTDEHGACPSCGSCAISRR